MKHHVLIFRHCVRSTHYGFNSHMDESPDWQVPEKWCLGEHAMDMVYESGLYLANHILKDESSLEFEIISDFSRRDVTTAHELSSGLFDALEAKGISPESARADTIRQEEWIFGEDVCKEYFNEDTITDEIMDRIHSLKPPDMSMHEGIHMMRDLVGSGDFPDSPSYKYHFSRSDWALTGAARHLNVFAEILFYAKAVGLDFAPDATIQQVYSLLQFHHWSRSIRYTNNSRAASRGAVWMNYIWNIFEANHEKQLNSRQPTTKVTIFVGHDDDLNSIATALGATWHLNGYESHSDFLPAPPGSALHMEVNVPDGNNDLLGNETTVNLQVLAPIYHDNSIRDFSQNWTASLSGDLYGTPVKLSHWPIIDGKTNIPYSALQNHVQQILEGWPIAEKCYEESRDWIAQHDIASGNTENNFVSGSGVSAAGHSGSFILSSLIAAQTLFLLFLACALICRRRRSQGSAVTVTLAPMTNETISLVEEQPVPATIT